MHIHNRPRFTVACIILAVTTVTTVFERVYTPDLEGAFALVFGLYVLTLLVSATIVAKHAWKYRRQLRERPMWPVFVASTTGLLLFLDPSSWLVSGTILIFGVQVTGAAIWLRESLWTGPSQTTLDAAVQEIFG